MNASGRSRRLVLESGFVDQKLRDVIARHGWAPLCAIPAKSTVTNEWAWKVDPEHSFHCLRCVKYPIDYCLVVGPRHDEVLVEVSSELDFLDVDDLLNAFDRASTIEEKEVTTFALGLCAGDAPEGGIYQRVRAAMYAPSPRVRMAAIDAAFVTEWSLFRTDFERLASTDLDLDVKEVAANALTGIVGSPPPSTLVQ